jgi:GT2 family glycosyltransferase
MTSLHVELDRPLPETVAAGAPTALFLSGWAYAHGLRLKSLELLVDGRPQPALAWRMPRVDVLTGASGGEPEAYAYRSGFWGLARFTPGGDPVTLGVRALLADGSVREAAVARVQVRALPDPAQLPASAGGEDLVGVAMAAYEPEPDLFGRQVESLRAQTHGNWICVISDDASSPRGRAAIRAAVGDDPRFVVSHAERRAGFYGNFERALALVPREVRYVALADQDDVWYPEKLASLLGGIGDAALVYSDARVVDRAGRVRADTYWERRRNNHQDLLSLLVANSVTGAASLLRRELLDDALPFPPAQFAHFHDHWLALVARTGDGIAYLDRPLYDYVQHEGASLGHAAANTVPALRDRVAGLRSDPRERVRRWRFAYFIDACRLQQVATILLDRRGAALAAADRRVLEDFLSAERSVLPLARLAGRGARELLWRRRPEDPGRRPETLGAEWLLFVAFSWRRMAEAIATETPRTALHLEAIPPPTLIQHPGRGGPTIRQVQVVQEKIAPLEIAVGDGAPRVNLLIPTIDLDHFFGGYIGKFNLADRLARRGARVRMVTVDPVPPLPRDWQGRIQAYQGLESVFDRVEVAFGRESPRLDLGRDDTVIATTWWTAHMAHRAARELGRERFLYLIQEYEPFTFPMGSWAALAEQSYRFPHTALFSTELLREYFRRHGLGVYAVPHGDDRSASFQNAITDVDPPRAEDLQARSPRRLLFYARPEEHAARNLFELGILALRRALASGALRGWELRGIGTTAFGGRIPLGTGAAIELLPRAAQRGYGALLREHDVGMALMHTPHPSLVPVEMASAGLVTVTSTFEHKTAAALAEISPNLLGADPTVEAVASALAEAAERARDPGARMQGALGTRWSRSWDTSFDAALLDRVDALLGA